jgi:hypothetical protein
MENKKRNQIIERLVLSDYSCIVVNGEREYIGQARGVKDLMHLLKDEPQLLDGAFVADKVVGKGAAALITLGKVSEVYAVLISRPALTLLQGANVTVNYDTLVDNIINRAGTDICPVEKLCKDADTAEQCLPLIENFISQMTNK